MTLQAVLNCKLVNSSIYVNILTQDRERYKINICTLSSKMISSVKATRGNTDFSNLVS